VHIACNKLPVAVIKAPQNKTPRNKLYTQINAKKHSVAGIICMVHYSDFSSPFASDNRAAFSGSRRIFYGVDVPAVAVFDYRSLLIAT
jgi:hypothetical protein